VGHLAPFLAPGSEAAAWLISARLLRARPTNRLLAPLQHAQSLARSQRPVLWHAPTRTSLHQAD